MYPVDLYLISKTKPLNIVEFNRYVKSLSKSKRDIYVRDYERDNLYQLVKVLKDKAKDANLQGFYYSYSLDQIGKEFDLIKVYDGFVLNIELKSEFTSTSKIEHQLLVNAYYLKALRKNAYFFTYIADINQLYTLDENNKLITSSIDVLVNIVSQTEQYFEGDLDKLMNPLHFLVSPLNNTEKFLQGEYFLTQQQQKIKKEILNDICEEQKYKFYKIVGNAGTGKTLLIYDIAKELARTKKVCVVHSGMLNHGHHIINDRIDNCDVLSAKEFNRCEYSKYEIIIIDEAQRFYVHQFEKLINFMAGSNSKAIFSIGQDQIMQKSEKRNDISGKIDKMVDVQKHQLSDRIRTNSDMLAFITNIIDLSKINKAADYANIDIFYVPTKAEAIELVNYLHSMSYEYISFTPSKYKIHEIDDYQSKNNTHAVIGQEFDRVVMIMGQNFQYVENKLSSPQHPNPDYIFSMLFYQGITRAREKLAIIVLRNPELYKRLTSIKTNNAK